MKSTKIYPDSDSQYDQLKNLLEEMKQKRFSYNV